MGSNIFNSYRATFDDVAFENVEDVEDSTSIRTILRSNLSVDTNRTHSNIHFFRKKNGQYFIPSAGHKRDTNTVFSYLCPNQNTFVCNRDTVFQRFSAMNCVEVAKHCVLNFNTVLYSYAVGTISSHFVTTKTFKSSVE